MGKTANIRKNAFLSEEGGEVRGKKRTWERMSTSLGHAEKGLWEKIWRVSNSRKEMILPHKASLLEGFLRQRNARVEAKWRKTPMMAGKPLLYSLRLSLEIKQG